LRRPIARACEFIHTLKRRMMFDLFRGRMSVVDNGFLLIYYPAGIKKRACFLDSSLRILLMQNAPFGMTRAFVVDFRRQLLLQTWNL
ncbi:MAG: hypothetical protein ACOYM7_11630, partial [Paludibacter sp.]